MEHSYCSVSRTNVKWFPVLYERQFHTAVGVSLYRPVSSELNHQCRPSNSFHCVVSYVDAALSDLIALRRLYSDPFYTQTRTHTRTDGVCLREVVLVSGTC